jgi:membrane-associated protease RseP (regulator of RpoE activity)
LLYLFLKAVVFGRVLPAEGMDVFLHPVAFAGWAGLFVTALNLVPAGQLDGGHIVGAVLGDRSVMLNYVLIGAMLLLGFLLWEGWFLWAVLLYAFSRRRAAPMDDVTPLTPRERAIALAMMVLFVLVFMPTPVTFID